MGFQKERHKVDESFPYRLRAARLKAGLGLKDMAKKMGGLARSSSLFTPKKFFLSKRALDFQKILKSKGFSKRKKG